jgi:hypothetical protein
MVRSAALSGLFVLLAGCANNRAARVAVNAPVSTQVELTEKSKGLFVGHTDSGEVVVAANHYNAMNGLAILDTDLGIPAQFSQGMMLCSREVHVGTHVPRWLCRYQKDIEYDRTMTALGLNSPVNSPFIPGSASSVILGVGGGGHSSRSQAK